MTWKQRQAERVASAGISRKALRRFDVALVAFGVLYFLLAPESVSSWQLWVAPLCIVAATAVNSVASVPTEREPHDDSAKPTPLERVSRRTAAAIAIVAAIPLLVLITLLIAGPPHWMKANGGMDIAAKVSIVAPLLSALIAFVYGLTALLGPPVRRQR